MATLQARQTREGEGDVNTARFWFNLSAVTGTGSALSLAAARIAPDKWTIAAYLLLFGIGVAMVMVGAALFAGWRPRLPAVPAVPLGYSASAHRYSSEQLRQVDGDANAERWQHEGAVVDFLRGSYRKA